MIRKCVGGFVLAAALAVPAGAWAHGGHLHNVLGTVSSVKGTQVEVKGTEGKTITVMLDAKTAITRGKAKLDASALKAGERVSIDYTQDKSLNMAKTVKLGTAPAAPPAGSK